MKVGDLVKPAEYPNRPDYNYGIGLVVKSLAENPFIVHRDDPKEPRWAVLWTNPCLLYTSPSPRDGLLSRMPSSA